MFSFFKKKTHFKAGYCILEDIHYSADNSMKESPLFVAPRRIDSRDLCLASSDQGNSSACTGYATAGYCEVQRWKRLHFPEQLDGLKNYKRSMERTGCKWDEGTTLKEAAKSALDLGWIQGEIKYVYPYRSSLQYALHTHGVVIGGFKITDEWNTVSGRSGMIYNFGDKAIVEGGHAVLICGFSNDGVYIQNSWGNDWGKYGFAILSWEQFDKQFYNGIVFEETF